VSVERFSNPEVTRRQLLRGFIITVPGIAILGASGKDLDSTLEKRQHKQAEKQVVDQGSSNVRLGLDLAGAVTGEITTAVGVTLMLSSKDHIQNEEE
jgi:hypothetical protein